MFVYFKAWLAISHNPLSIKKVFAYFFFPLQHPLFLSIQYMSAPIYFSQKVSIYKISVVTCFLPSLQGLYKWTSFLYTICHYVMYVKDYWLSVNIFSFCALFPYFWRSPTLFAYSIYSYYSYCLFSPISSPLYNFNLILPNNLKVVSTLIIIKTEIYNWCNPFTCVTIVFLKICNLWSSKYTIDSFQNTWNNKTLFYNLKLLTIRESVGSNKT